MTTKRWCEACKFMTYGDCHPKTDIRAIDDVRTEPGIITLLPFPNVIIPGHATANVSANPQLAGAPLHLAVDPAAAPFFDILDIKIGVNSTIINCGSMPAACFVPQPEDPRLHLGWNNLAGMPPWRIGQYVILQVYNKDQSAHAFSAVMRAKIIPNDPPKIVLQNK